MEYRLRDASDEDAPYLEGLRRRTYAELFEATWGGWDENRHRRQLWACLRAGGISLIEADGELVGMIQLFEHADSLEIAEVQIEPVHQGRGIGTAVIRDVICRAANDGLPVNLRVGRKNEGALRLYERLGFKVVGESETHRRMTHRPEG